MLAEAAFVDRHVGRDPGATDGPGGGPDRRASVASPSGGSSRGTLVGSTAQPSGTTSPTKACAARGNGLRTITSIVSTSPTASPDRYGSMRAT